MRAVLSNETTSRRLVNEHASRRLVERGGVVAERGHHVVVGSGAVGSAVTRMLVDRGDEVIVVTRSGSGLEHELVRPVAADAGDGSTLTGLAEGAAALYNCANPQYHRWATDWPPIAAAILSAAERSGPVLATCSNLYGYGPVNGPMTEDLPLTARFVKGRVRAQMWEEALAAHDGGRVRATEVRASDYLGPTNQGQFGDRVIPKLLAGKPATVLGDPTVPHTWTYTDDVARALVTVAADERAWGRAWHVPSHEACSATEVVERLCRFAGVDPVPVRRMPGWMLAVAKLFVPIVRELPDVMYQHTRPFVMDDSAARRTFGLAPSDWDTILAETIRPYQQASLSA